MGAQKHIHKYYRLSARWKGYKPGPEIVYHCALSDCTHYMPKRLIVGKISLCNMCEDELILTPERLRVRKPICEKCKRVKIRIMGNDAEAEKLENNERTERAIDETVDKLLKGV